MPIATAAGAMADDGHHPEDDSRKFVDLSLTPVRITIIYVVLGFVALFVSDILLVWVLSEPLLSQIQTVKGGVEVLLTAGLILVLTERRETQLESSRTRLKRRNDELRLLHRVLRHNFRNDLNVLIGYTELLKNNVSAETLQTYCDRILNTCADMRRYAERAKQIKETTKSEQRLQGYNVEDLLDEVIASNQDVVQRARLTSKIPADAELIANPMIAEALGEILENAVEYSDSEEPKIDIDVTQKADRMNICITDDGPGIPKEELDALKIAESDQIRHLSGMGLWFVAWTVERSGGDIQIESDKGGTTVCLEFDRPAFE